MPNPFGNLGAELITFEETLRCRTKTETEYVDGYARPKLSESQIFKGVITPSYEVDSRFGGIVFEGDSILYVRLTQENVPRIRPDDRIEDGYGQMWKIIREHDYSKHGKVKLYDMMKVEPKC